MHTVKSLGNKEKNKEKASLITQRQPWLILWNFLSSLSCLFVYNGEWKLNNLVYSDLFFFSFFFFLSLSIIIQAFWRKEL